MITAVEPGAGWWVALLGWPAVVGAVGAGSAAVPRSSRAAAVIGCLFAAPIFAYLSLAPRFHWVAPLAFGLLCVLAWRVERFGRVASGILATPAAGLLLWLGYAVLMQ